MSANVSASRKWAVPIALAAGFALILVLSNRPVKTPDGLDVIDNPDAYNAVVKKAEQLSRPIFEAADRGESLTEQQKADLRQSIRYFDEMDVYQPTRVGAFIGAGKAFQLLGDFEQADERLRQCISNAQYDQTTTGKLTVIEAQHLLSEVRGMQGKWKDAFDLADQTIKAMPNSAVYLGTRASAEIQLNRIPEAKADIVKALVLDPTNRRVLDLQRLLQSSGK